MERLFFSLVLLVGCVGESTQEPFWSECVPSTFDGEFHVISETCDDICGVTAQCSVADDHAEGQAEFFFGDDQCGVDGAVYFAQQHESLIRWPASFDYRCCCAGG